MRSLGHIRHGLRRVLYNSASLYLLWERLRERQQRGHFTELLDRYLRDCAHSRGYSERVCRLALANKSHDRRPIHGEARRPVVVAFGALEWEQYGLWPSFGRCATFRLWNYGARCEQLLKSSASAEVIRQTLEKEFIEFVDEVDKREPVTCVFVYAAGVYLSDSLFDQLHSRGIWTVVMGLDDKHQFFQSNGLAASEPRQLTIARKCDLYWTTWRTGTEIVLRVGGTPWYAPEAADSAFHRPLIRTRDIDVLFVGQCYGYRRALLEYLRRRGFRTEAYGKGWPYGYLTFEQTVEAYNRAHIVLGVGGVGYIRGVNHLKGRDFEVPMCGALYLTTFNPELADHFEIGKDILCYGSPEECADVAHWILRSPPAAQRIRDAALRRSLSSHTWDIRLHQMFSQFPRS